MAPIEQVLQSYQFIQLDDRADIHFVVKIRDMLRNMSSIIQIKDDKTELCWTRAIVTAIAIIGNHPKVKQKKIGRKEQEYLARDLHAKAGVKEGPCGIEEIRKFQDVFPDYRYRSVILTPPSSKGPSDDIPFTCTFTTIITI